MDMTVSFDWLIINLQIFEKLGEGSYAQKGCLDQSGKKQYLMRFKLLLNPQLINFWNDLQN